MKRRNKMFKLIETQDGDVLVDYNYDPEEIVDEQYVASIHEMEYPHHQLDMFVDNSFKSLYHEWTFKDYSKE